MATLKELYQLVQALDKSEKKNLSMMISAMGGKATQRYTKALHIINEQTEFDADKLKRKLSADISGMNLAEANGYFFNFVCKSLINSHAQAAGNLGLLKELALVEIFVAKGLFDMADKHLQPVLEKLYNGNSFGMLARALELNTTIVSSNPSTDFDFKRRFELVDKRIEVTKNNLQYLEVIRLNQRLTEIVYKVGDPRQKSHLQLYEPIYKNAVWQLPYSEISRQAFTILAPLKVDMVTLTLGAAEGIKECRLALAEFYRRFNLRDHHIAAFYLLDIILCDLIRVKRSDEMPAAIIELENLIPHVNHKAVRQKIYARLMFSELSLEIIRGNYPAGIKKLDAWMKESRKINWQEAPLAYMNYILGARLHYLNNSPNKALDYLLILRSNEKTFRASMLLTYHFMFLLCYYKLDNHSLVISTANSIYKSLLKQQKLYAPERALLRFVKSNGTTDKIKSNMKELYNTLIELNKDPLNASFFQYGDYLEWLKMELDKKH